MNTRVSGRPLDRIHSVVKCSLVIGVSFGSSACDRLLSVESGTQIIASQLTNPDQAQLLVNSAMSALECAMPYYVLAGGLIGNELADAALANAMTDYDRRSSNAANSQYQFITCQDAATAIGVYPPVSTARWQADQVLQALEGWSDAEVPNRLGLIATTAAYSGYSLVLLGEAFCSAAIDLGPELTKAQIFDLAEQRLTRAIDAAGTDNARASIRNMALVGRARVRLNLGGAKLPGAVADAQQVPAGFARTTTHSSASPRRENRVYVFNGRQRWVSVDGPYRNLTFNGVPDPRVRVVDAAAKGEDAVTPLWMQTKYPAASTPIPFARHAEAQLIIAEVVGGQQAVGIINALHTAAALPPFNSSDPAAIRAQVIDERKREFFLEGQHLGDIQRYNLPLFPSTGTPYPPKAGGVYGNQVCLPLPDVERKNNPNIH